MPFGTLRIAKPLAFILIETILKPSQMKQLILSICIAFLFFQNAYCIYNYNQGDELVVWAKSGLNLREEPNIQSKVITKIVLGKTVVAQEGKDLGWGGLEIKDKQTLADGQGFTMTLRGVWVKVKFNDYEGFLFDAYLSKIKYGNDKPLYKLLIDQKEICNDYRLRSKLTGNTRRTILNDGTYINSWFYQSGSGYDIMIPFFSFEEAFLICIALISNPPKEIVQDRMDEIWIDEDTIRADSGGSSSWSIIKVGNFVCIKNYGGC